MSNNDSHEHPSSEKRLQQYLDVPFSRFVSRVIRARPNACFDNVLDLCLTGFPDLCLACGVKCIEGWYVVDGKDEVVLNEHGWCEWMDGRIIDPTVVCLVPLTQPVYYFPGVQRSWQEVYDIAQQRDSFFPYVRCVGAYGEDGLGHPAYRAAYEAARQKVVALAHATKPPKRMTFLTAQDLEGEGGLQIQVRVFLIAPKPPREEQDDGQEER